MADETTQTETEIEQAGENPATAHQPAETVTRVYDAEGREHFASPTSKFVGDGLADGTLTTEPPARTDESGGEQRTEEVPSGAETGSASHDHEPGTGDGTAESGDGPADAGNTGGRRRTGKA
ncbi:hypothetical protein [Amycolatopsis sp. cmx-4-83]|uniref:hypothetical protein n=1 Tax=Amycolatopsis sp. cmx-4-83 TaxID=2790940 RepID=UPI0039784548